MTKMLFVEVVSGTGSSAIDGAMIRSFWKDCGNDLLVVEERKLDKREIGNTVLYDFAAHRYRWIVISKLFLVQTAYLKMDQIVNVQ